MSMFDKKANIGQVKPDKMLRYYLSPLWDNKPQLCFFIFPPGWGKWHGVPKEGIYKETTSL